MKLRVNILISGPPPPKKTTINENPKIYEENKLLVTTLSCKTDNVSTIDGL